MSSASEAIRNTKLFHLMSEEIIFKRIMPILDSLWVYWSGVQTPWLAQRKRGHWESGESGWILTPRSTHCALSSSTWRACLMTGCCSSGATRTGWNTSVPQANKLFHSLHSRQEGVDRGLRKTRHKSEGGNVTLGWEIWVKGYFIIW